MTDIGIEVGQKMRLAIKAKLTELNCYVDDELPDYIMVMIANKRTKSQMKEDLNLFLANETSFFVEWLHIVLKKLKEVQVTNPNVFKNHNKRKCAEYFATPEDLKKVKKEEVKTKTEADVDKYASFNSNQSNDQMTSLTDDLPLRVGMVSEGRSKISLMGQTNQSNSNIFIHGVEDDFDIPLLSEINASNEEELEHLEKRIRNVKSRLGLQVDSDNNDEDDDHDVTERKIIKQVDCANTKKSPALSTRKIISSQIAHERAKSDDKCEKVVEKPTENKRSTHTSIVFDKEKDSLEAKYNAIMKNSQHQSRHDDNRSGNSGKHELKKRSILDRLGKRSDKDVNKRVSVDTHHSTLQSKVIRPQKQRISDKKVASKILNSVGMLSTVSMPPKKVNIPQTEKKLIENEKEMSPCRSVASVVKIKPRVMPEKTRQANPSLLFKAVAEAQRSVSQTPAVGKYKDPNSTNTKSVKSASSENAAESSTSALFTKSYREQMTKLSSVSVSAKDLSRLKNKRTAELLDNDSIKLSSSADKEKSESEDRKSTKLPVKDTDLLKTKITIQNIREKSPPINMNILEDVKATDENEGEIKSDHKFIVTLDGIDKSKYAHLNNRDIESSEPEIVKYAQPSTQDAQSKKVTKAPSPIVFEHEKLKPVVTVAPTKSKVVQINKKPEILPRQTLPVVPPVVKKSNVMQGKCKFFPNCKLGDSCEFVHPSMCKMFPNCKFADQCLYTHPICKFEMSCTRKNCPYSHSTHNADAGTGGNNPALCKYFPNCSNSRCSFYHPKMCKYGIHCKNASCGFQHSSENQIDRKLTWRLLK